MWIITPSPPHGGTDGRGQVTNWNYYTDTQVSAGTIRRLMARHRVTIRAIAARYDITIKRVRYVRANGGPFDWPLMICAVAAAR